MLVNLARKPTGDQAYYHRGIYRTSCMRFQAPIGAGHSDLPSPAIGYDLTVGGTLRSTEQNLCSELAESIYCTVRNFIQVIRHGDQVTLSLFCLAVYASGTRCMAARRSGFGLNDEPSTTAIKEQMAVVPCSMLRPRMIGAHSAAAKLTDCLTAT